MKDTQEKFVINSLLMNGEITRNECLKNYITRLGAIVCNLKKRGWEFMPEKRETIKPDGKKGYDFVYRLVKSPMSNYESDNIKLF